MTIARGSSRLLRGGVVPSLLGGVATGAAMFLVNVLAARTLAPAEFADVAFCLALAQVWFIATVAGLELAGPRHVAGVCPERRGAAAGSVLALSGSFAAAAVLLSFPVAEVLARATSSPRSLVHAAVVLGVATGLRAVLERLVAALGLLNRIAVVKAAEGVVIIVGAVLVLALAPLRGWLGVVVAVATGAALAVTAYVLGLRREVDGLSVRREDLSDVWVFARHAAPSTVFAVVLMYADKFALRIGASDQTYALYSAYFAGSLVIAVQGVFVLQSVVLPASVRAAGSIQVRRRILHALPRMLLLLPCAYVATLWMVLGLLGPDYDFTFRHAVPFSLWAAAYTANLLCLTALVGRSTAAMRRESWVLAARAAVACGALLALSSSAQLDFMTVVLVMLCIEVLEVVNVVWMTRRYLVA